MRRTAVWQMVDTGPRKLPGSSIDLERQLEDWIEKNLDVFWAAATAAFDGAGRGAVVVDTTLEPIPDAGNPFGYFSQEQLEETADEDTKRMVTEYDPLQEMVLLLLKSDNRTSTYRVGALSPGCQEAVADRVLPRSVSEPVAEPQLKPPDVDTLIEWEAEGGCEAACPHHCWTEPDGVCAHGNPSWLLKLGLI